MRRRPLLAGVVALAITGMAVAVLWALGTTASGREKFSTVSFIPRDSVVYVALNTDAASSQWVSLASLLDDIEVAEPLRNAWSDLLAEEDVDWEEDIVALLGGEAAFAATSYEAAAEGGGIVFVAQVRDRDKAEDTFLRLIRRSTSDAGLELLRDEYEGVTIHYSEATGSLFGGGSTDEGAVAFLEDLVVFGVLRDDVKAVIDVVEGREPGLDENERFREARGRQEDDFLVYGYIDAGSAWAMFDDFTADLGLADSETQSALDEARAQADVVTFAVRAQQYGIVVDTDVVRAPGAGAIDDLPDYDAALARRLPQSTVFFAGGRVGESVLGEQFPTLRDGDPFFDELVRDFEAEVGFSLESGLLDHLDGEMALALDLSLDGPLQFFSGLFVAEVDDPRTVNDSMTRLTRWLDREGHLAATPPDRNGITWLLVDDFGADAAAWGMVDEALVVGFPYRAVEDYRAKLNRSLADTATWKRLQELLPEDYNYLGYVSIERLLEELNTQVDVDTELRALTDGDFGISSLRPIKAIGMTGNSDSRGQSARIVLLIED